MKKLEALLEWGGTKRDISFSCHFGNCLDPESRKAAAALRSGMDSPSYYAVFRFLLEAFVGLVTAFDIKADVLVSLALIASVVIGEIFAAGEVAFYYAGSAVCWKNSRWPAPVRE